MPDSQFVSRRQFIRYLSAAGAGLLLPSTVMAGLTRTPEKHLEFYNLHTGESLSTTFCSSGIYQPDSMAEINHLLRDYRTNQACQMDTDLMELLFRLRQTLDTDKPFHVISGYRSPTTNKMLSQKSSGVAKKSLHMEGKAIDIRIPGVELKDLHQAALSLQGGGVGLYTKSNFVHVDVGRVRNWGS